MIYKLIPFLFLLAVAGCRTQETRPAGRFKTLMLKADGKVETLPDIATFRIQLDCLDKSVIASKACLVQKSNELNKKLLSFGFKQEDILTTAVNLNKSYSWSKNTRILDGYNSSTVLYITVKDLNKLDAIYTELLENRNLEISGLAYSHSQLDSLKNEAYVNALKNANRMAEKLIKQLPGTEKEILKIGNVEVSASLPEMPHLGYAVEAQAAVADEAPRGNSIAISKGTVQVNATLFVEFLLKE